MKRGSLADRKSRFLKIFKRLQGIYGEDKGLPSDNFLKYGNKSELLISVILSAQTTDAQVNKVTAKLFEKYKNIDDYLNADLKEFEKDISSVGLYKSKARNILKTVRILKDKFGGEVPGNLKDLISLSGVGRKTANVVLWHGFGVSEGIVVDTHVARFAKRFGFTDSDNPEIIERDLMEIVPRELWGRIMWYLIRYGREFGPAKGYDKENDPLGEFVCV